MLKYRGYWAKVEYDGNAKLYVGILQDVPDDVRFTATSIAALKSEMGPAVDRYIDFCMEWGRPSLPQYSSDYTVHVVA